MTRTCVWSLLVLAAVGLASGASALEPKKASDLVTLEANGLCRGVEGQIYDLRVLPDGSSAPFEIPEGRVLVVTRWMFRFGGGTPGAGQIAYLEMDPGEGLALVPYTYDSGGLGAGTLELSAVVGAGKKVCGFHDDSTNVTPLGGFLEGYLAGAK